MSITSKYQRSLQLSSISDLEPSNYLTSILLKKEKTLEDAQIIYEQIRRFSFFHDFFAANLNKMELPKILNLCQGFKYERCPKESFVYKQGEPSNQKLYIILSGEVAVINHNNVGDFGESQPTAASTASTASTASFKSLASKQSLVTNRRATSLGTIGELDLHEIDSKKVIKRLDCIDTPEENVDTQQKLNNGIGKTKTSTKLRAVYDAVKALRSLQRCLPNLKKSSEIDISKNEPPQTVATLQHLDDGEDEQEAVRKDFEALASKYGKITQYLGVGESFGELGLKKTNKSRPVSVLCRVGCEFLTLEKKQFDNVFGEIEREKEEFLKSVFPQLGSFSSANFHYLVCFFKTERYSKGCYIINEGKSPHQQKAKFYIIQAGECLIEKKLLRELNNPYNTKRTLVSTYDNVQITMAGKGSIVGEEIISNEGEYEYSIKALTDIVLVQAITKKDFRLRFPQEFIEYISSMYETKKAHREEIFKNIKADSVSKMDKYKADNIYCIANASIADLTTNTAKQFFSRHMQRSETQTPTVLSATISPRNQPPSYRESSLASVRTTFHTESLKEISPRNFPSIGFDIPSATPKPGIHNKSDPLIAKIEALGRASSPQQKQFTNYNKDNSEENINIFAELENSKDRKTVKIRLSHISKQNKEEKSTSQEPKTNYDHKNLLLNRLLSKKADIKYLHKALTSESLGNTDNCKSPCATPQPITAQSTRGSMKSIGLQDLSSLYHQKLIKGRPSLNPRSPSINKMGSSEINLEINEGVLTQECLIYGPLEQIHHRKTGSFGPYSLGIFNVQSEPSKALNSTKTRETVEVNEELSTRLGSDLKTEGEREIKKFSGFAEQQKGKDLEITINKRKNVPQTVGTSKSKGRTKDENVKEKNIYAHLNDAKEWRMKVFKKTKRQGSIENLKVITENIIVKKEKYQA